MIENIREKEEEVKKIWLEYRDKMITSLLYRNFLSPYFEIVPKIQGTKDWLFFLQWISKWRGVEKKENGKKEKKEVETELEDITDEDVDEIQAQNRRRVVLMLGRLLNNYDKESDAVKKAMSFADIMGMYKAVQSLEEKMKRTDIARGKLKLDAVRTLLPYKRLKVEELVALKEKLNESFDRIIKLKGGGAVGQPRPNSG